MNAKSSTSHQKSQKATVTDEVPVRQPADKPQSQPQQATTTHTVTIGESNEYQNPGPGFNHRVTNYPGGYSVDTVNGVNPVLGQQQPAQIHQTPGFSRATHTQPGYPINNTAGPQYYNHTIPTAQAHHIPQFSPIYYPHYHVSIPSSICKMGDYGNGFMPNTSQHFQPPVPDTTYGPIPHTYHPRFDGGMPFAQVSNTGYSAGYVAAAAPSVVACACPTCISSHPVGQPIHIAGHSPPVVVISSGPQACNCLYRLQAANGIMTAPIPIPMAYPHHHQQTPIVVQGGPAAMHGFPVQPQQVITAQPAMMPQGIPFPGGQPQMVIGNGTPGMHPSSIPPPDVMGIGKTAGEFSLDQRHAAFKNNILEPQDFKPADDDPSRMYFCRELDGNWTQRNRYTIDRLPCRWYITEFGAFYAVRLED